MSRNKPTKQQKYLTSLAISRNLHEDWLSGKKSKNERSELIVKQ